jgi:hypothetical protein
VRVCMYVGGSLPLCAVWHLRHGFGTHELYHIGYSKRPRVLHRMGYSRAQCAHSITGTQSELAAGVLLVTMPLLRGGHGSAATGAQSVR